MECIWMYNAIPFDSIVKIINFDSYLVAKRGPSDATQDI